MDLGFKLAVSNQKLKHPTSRQIFGDTSGLLCKNDPILRLTKSAFYGKIKTFIIYLPICDGILEMSLIILKIWIQ